LRVSASGRYSINLANVDRRLSDHSARSVVGGLIGHAVIVAAIAIIAVEAVEATAEASAAKAAMEPFAAKAAMEPSAAETATESPTAEASAVPRQGRGRRDRNAEGERRQRSGNRFEE